MNFPPPLTRAIGRAERSLRALLDSRLQQVNLSFPQWVSLVSLSGGPKDRDALIQLLLDGRAADADTAAEAIEQLLSSGRISRAGSLLDLTDDGRVAFQQVADAIAGITARLYGDLPAADLEITQRTLGLLGDRAQALLA